KSPCQTGGTPRDRTSRSRARGRTRPGHNSGPASSTSGASETAVPSRQLKFTTSPPFRVAAYWYVGKSMLLETKRTLPSQRRKFAPLLCSLPKLTSLYPVDPLYGMELMGNVTFRVEAQAGPELVLQPRIQVR